MANGGELQQQYREDRVDQLGDPRVDPEHHRALEHDLHGPPCSRNCAQKALTFAMRTWLGFEHINMLGRYSFAMHEAVARGQLRPLRDPDDGAAEGA